MRTTKGIPQTFFLCLVLNLCNGFVVYWNVPTMRCQKHGIYFNLSEYNIIQNSGDQFRGEHININYKPALFPYYKENEPVSGGIPQNGELDAHVQEFESQVIKEVSENIDGYAIIDFEDYQPYYNVTSIIYKNASKEWVKSEYPDLPQSEIRQVAESSFNEAARPFFERLLEIGRRLRPKAKWGYYHYPYCRNRLPDPSQCLPRQYLANEEIDWLFKSSGALFPSIYIFKEDWNVSSRRQQVIVRLKNAIKLNEKSNADILSYVWFKYHDARDFYLSKMDLLDTLGMSAYLKLTGSIIWGSSLDVNSEAQCLELKAYVKGTLGPLVKFLTQFY